MTLTTADRDALRAYLATEFHRWVETLLSRDELPLVGSAVLDLAQYRRGRKLHPAVRPPRRPRPRPRHRRRHRLHGKTSAPREEDKAPREEDKTSAPAAPAREDQVPAPVASSYHCDLCDEDGHDRRSRFCRSRPQPMKPKRKEPQEDAMDTAPPAPTTSVATTQTAQATCTIGTQVDIPMFADLTEWRPSHNRDVKIRQQDWLDHANFEDITGRQDTEGYQVDFQVNVPFPAANEVLARQLAKSGISGHDCKDAQCISATRHLISVPISKALRVYARALDTDIELQTTSTSQVFLKSIAGRQTRESDKLRHFIPKISPPVIDPFAAEFARLGIPKLPV